MEQPIHPVLPPEENATYSIIVQNGSRGVHKFRIIELLAAQHGFNNINQPKLRKLIYNMNHKTLWKLKQRIVAERNSGIYVLRVEGKKYGETTKESAEKTDMEVHLPAAGKER